MRLDASAHAEATRRSTEDALKAIDLRLDRLTKAYPDDALSID